MMRLTSTLAAAALILSACGQEGGDPMRYISGIGSDTFRGTPSVQLTNQELAALPKLAVSLPDRGATATLIPIQTSGDRVTWLTRDQSTVTLRAGILTATRGLGDDMMSAESARVLSALRSGQAASYDRIYAFLDGENQTVFRAFACQMRPEGMDGSLRRTSETCNSLNLQIRNTYWRNGSGRVVRSVQWVSDGVGYADLREL